MIKNLIFDVYGTLVSTGNGSVMATAEIFKEFGLQNQAKEIYKEWKKYHKKHTSECEEFRTERDAFIEDLRCLFAERNITAKPEEKVQPMLDSLYGRTLFLDVEESMARIMGIYHVAIGSTTDNDPLYDSISGTVLDHGNSMRNADLFFCQHVVCNTGVLDHRYRKPHDVSPECFRVQQVSGIYLRNRTADPDYVPSSFRLYKLLSVRICIGNG